jgi:hypothetical protein
MSEDKIINRIKKMLALANDLAASEGERDNALRMAYNLMAKHNLDIATVEAHGKKSEEPRIKFDSDGWSWTWAKQTRNIVADLFFCKYFFGQKINGTQCHHHFVGRESNAMTAAVMSDWIVDSILKEGRAIYKQNTAPGTRAFAIGAMHKLYERVEQIKRERAAEMERESTGTALVLQDYYKGERSANEQWIAEHIGGLKHHAARHSKVNADAYAQGQEFGAKINLNTQVSHERKGSARLK